jgi:hypothetical protein
MSLKINQIVFTAVAVLVFVGLLVASASSPHPDRLRWAALIWLGALGVINAVLLLFEMGGDPRTSERTLDRE